MTSSKSASCSIRDTRCLTTTWRSSYKALAATSRSSVSILHCRMRLYASFRYAATGAFSLELLLSRATISKMDTNTSNTKEKFPPSFSCTDDRSLSFPSSTGSLIVLGDAMGESSSIQSSVGVCADLFSEGILKLVLCDTGMAKD
jgi:hypothetical protein